jgi:hypothetical protein
VSGTYEGCVSLEEGDEDCVESSADLCITASYQLTALLLVWRGNPKTHGSKVVKRDERGHLDACEELLDGDETGSLEGDSEGLADESSEDKVELSKRGEGDSSRDGDDDDERPRVHLGRGGNVSEVFGGDMQELTFSRPIMTERPRTATELPFTPVSTSTISADTAATHVKALSIWRVAHLGQRNTFL